MRYKDNAVTSVVTIKRKTPIPIRPANSNNERPPLDLFIPVMFPENPNCEAKKNNEQRIRELINSTLMILYLKR